MLTSVGAGREEDSQNLSIQGSLCKNEELATFTSRCQKDVQEQPVSETCHASSYLITFVLDIPLTGNLFPGSVAELLTQI